MILSENYLKMTYKEALFFIGKCLTISQEKENLQYVTQQVQSNHIDWDAIVKTSTAHYVFPALYCNLSRANLLSFLPEELVSYMKHITDLNRGRNLQIIDQATQINELLTSHGITVVFVKGTGFLLQNFYDDLGERMLGDIDFIVAIEHYQKANTILKENGYSEVLENDYPSFKHLPRLQKQDSIAAVEIHKEVVNEKYAQEFNHSVISSDILSVDNFAVMSYKNQLILTIASKQINDNGQYFNTISLRNAYDVFLLSKKTDSLLSIQNSLLLFHLSNNFLALCHLVLNTESIRYEENATSRKYMYVFDKILADQKFRKRYHQKQQRKILFKKGLKMTYDSLFDKNYRKWFFNRFLDKKWQREKMVQLGLKSSS